MAEIGKQCLLRAICEAAEYRTKDTGVLGDLIHVLLTSFVGVVAVSSVKWDVAIGVSLTE
ncbi:hypothetical protein NQ317_008821 [Molorchus minor]|uniref:Uncharacterized protein n=1 Tax=Molorchus minor TaxID=1323400 RepID=A0ABQ9JUC4_9CUCU|nr:hypothetical protein NQ317_008821 [Molorchus minor]